jgi:ABC-type antimicrobial peptide transport system permease subunit
LAEEVDASTAVERLIATLSSTFGTIAALLTAVGLYGLLAYAVAQRRREIGIRMALGAQTVDIGVPMARQALGMVIGGMVLGLGAAVAAAQWMRSLLYGVAPSDPSSLAAAVVFVALVATLAIAIPVARATHIEPAAALRQEN